MEAHKMSRGFVGCRRNFFPPSRLRERGIQRHTDSFPARACRGHTPGGHVERKPSLERRFGKKFLKRLIASPAQKTE